MTPPEPTARLMLNALRQFERELQVSLHASGFEDVSIAHTNALRHLNPEGMQLGEWAADAGMTKQGIGQAAKALEARHLVHIGVDPDDRRAKRVTYTDRGRALTTCAIDLIVDIERQWCQQLGDDAYAGLRATLIGLSNR